jgi:type I restriction-modification system DNA methylase subunit
MDQATRNKIVAFIRSIADDVLRDLFKRGTYPDVILPMGTVFEELVRQFNEENNEEAGEHWTPRDAVHLMANLIFLPVADRIKSGAYLLYDGAAGTGGMLTVAEETLRQFATARGQQITTHLYA